MRTFTVDVELDEESGWLVAEVRELPGCFTEAPDMPTLRASLWEAITGYLKVAEPDSPALTDFVETWHIKAAA
jgi:predicted RNase H-like HicB family nuclease